MTKGFNHLKEIFNLDLRALGLFRIILSIILIIDGLEKLLYVREFFSNNGIGITSTSNNLLTSISFSINNLNGDISFQVFIILVYIICSIALLFGFKSRIFTIILWFLIASLQNRNSLVYQGGDDYLRLLLFWGIFLPLDKRYSISRYLTGDKHDSNYHYSFFNLGIILQIAFLYLFSALNKTDATWTTEFSAIYYSLRIDDLGTWVGKILLSNYLVTQILTIAVLITEYILPFLILIPFKKNLLRGIAAIMIIGFHLGSGAGMDVGIFPWVGIAGGILLLNTSTLDWLEKIIFKQKKVKNSEPKPLKTTAGLLYLLFLMPTMSLIFIWNVNFIDFRFPIELNSEFRTYMLLLRLDQYWGMFAPNPTYDNGWYVINGVNKDEEIVSLFGESEKTSFTEQPVNSHNLYKGDRWRKMMENLKNNLNTRYRQDFLKYYCEKNTDIEHIDMYYVEQFNKLDYSRVKTGEVKLAERDC